MAQTYSQLMAQINSLQTQAGKLKTTEVAAVIQKMKAQIQVYGIAPEDLFGTQVAKRATGAKKAGGAGKGQGPAKFADGKGNTWVGRGPRPQWLRDALNAGAALEDFVAGRKMGAGTPAPAQAASAPAPAKKTRAKKGSKGADPKKAVAAKKVKAKYADGAGNSWTGRGMRPRWLKAALESGRKIEDMMV